MAKCNGRSAIAALPLFQPIRGGSDKKGRFALKKPPVNYFIRF